MKEEIRLLNFFFFLFVAGLILFLTGSLLWNINDEKETKLLYAKVEASASFNKDLLYRRWAAMHGGVYVPANENTPPNPYLSFISDRDITTPHGKKFTLVNPAYMTRQVYVIADLQYGVKGHITSLNPLRPENKADEWETKVLKMFENGYEEYNSIDNINGKEYLRYMHRLMVEKNCLKCHASQGYKEGQVRGGISVSVPMAKYNAISHEKIVSLTTTHSVTFIIVLIFGYLGYKKIKDELNRRILIQQKIESNELDLKKQNIEYQKLNIELLKAKEKAEESEQLKTAFLQNMSHEIRTPINSIMGFSKMLNKEDLTSEKRKSYATIIRNSGAQLLDVVTGILTISSIETGQERLNIQKFCINDVILELVSIFKEQAGKQNLSLYSKKHLSDKQSVIYSDKEKIIQIFKNLIGNALKFTHSGMVEFGYTLSLLPESYSENIVKLTFYVKDTGIGISNDQQERIFEHFVQGDLSNTRRYGGTGLGLSIAKGFVEMLGGKLQVESVLNKGSKFYFTITCEHANIDELKEIGDIPGKEEITVLIAEDEESNYLYLEEILIDCKYNIIHAKNGQEAIDMCKANDQISLILMDIKMPMLDGHSAAIKIKEFRPGLPIIAVTAYALLHEIEKFKNQAFAEYLTKPIDEDQLKKVVTNILRPKI